jgi:hypothetical protein
MWTSTGLVTLFINLLFQKTFRYFRTKNKWQQRDRIKRFNVTVLLPYDLFEETAVSNFISDQNTLHRFEKFTGHLFQL